MDALEWAAVQSPIGVCYVAASGAGVNRVRLPGPRGGSSGGRSSARRPQPLVESADGVLGQAVVEIREYFAGKRRDFTVPIDWSRVDGFPRAVLSALRDGVPFGSVVSYGNLAARSGDPNAARAVGEIMATNPYPIVVACHRVVASDGLGGYGGGLEMKRWLLAHEGVLPPMLDFG